MNQTETGPSGFTETTVDEERIAIRVMIGDVVGRYRKQVPPDRVQKATFEVNGGLLMALLLALLMLVCIIQRLATGDRLMSFTGEPDVRDIQFADTAIPLFSRIAEEAKQRAAKNLSDDTYTLVLTNDEMNAICEAHGDLTQYLRKHAEKQNKGQA